MPDAVPGRARWVSADFALRRGRIHGTALIDRRGAGVT
jgi:hypothetical protein